MDDATLRQMHNSIADLHDLYKTGMVTVGEYLRAMSDLNFEYEHEEHPQTMCFEFTDIQGFRNVMNRLLGE